MKITGFGTISSTSGVQKQRGKGKVGAFADLLADADAADATAAANQMAAAAPLHHLLTLQEISEEDVQRRKTIQHGNALLDTLEGLRRQILSGGVTLATLDDMERQLAAGRLVTQDAKLNALMDDIELRVAVESAKLTMAKQSGNDWEPSE